MRTRFSRSAFRAVAVAIVKGFVRDRSALFFAIVFPLMFLFVFGGIFGHQGQSRIDLVEIGSVPLIDELPSSARKGFEQTFDVTRTSDRAAALAKVRKGDADVAVEMQGDTLVGHYTQTDQTQAAITQGVLHAFVDSANIAASGKPPTYRLQTERVEDKSLQAIQFFTPGLLGWAVAMSAAFGAATTLQGWRQSRLLRRLQLAPVSTGTIVSARVLVTVLIAIVQLVIFVGVGMGAFGLQLNGSWWMSVPILISGTLSFMALGLLAGALGRSTEGAVNMANFLVLPMAFLSGSFFPIDAMPGWLQALSKVLPLRHLNDGMMDVMVRGDGPAAGLLPIAILLAFAAFFTGLAARLFRWEQA
jgi:ABC-2 type transport system permease protein